MSQDRPRTSGVARTSRNHKLSYEQIRNSMERMDTQNESCKATTSQGGSPEAARTTRWHHFTLRCCRRLRAVRTRHCAPASTRGSCGTWGLEWPVFRTASGCAADEPPYSRSRAGSSVADVPALFELRAVGRDGGAASPRVPAP